MDQNVLDHVCCPQKRYLDSTGSSFSLSKHTRNCREIRERQLCARSALGVQAIEHPSNPTEANSAKEQLEVGHEEQSDSFLLHRAESSANESPGSYLLEFAELLFL